MRFREIIEACWKGYHKEGMKTMFGKRYPNCVKNKNESLETYINRGECPGCGGEMVAEDLITEKQDACYHKVKSRYKIWPSAYASGALVRCRKVGADNWGNKSKKWEPQNSSLRSGVRNTRAASTALVLEASHKRHTVPDVGRMRIMIQMRHLLGQNPNPLCQQALSELM